MRKVKIPISPISLGGLKTRSMLVQASVYGIAVYGIAILPLVLIQAMAQEPTPDATMLDAVVVTANKRVENVQEVPKQVMVVTPEALARSGVTTIRELGNVIPSITGASDDRVEAPTIRGVSSFATSIGVQTQTGVVIDDVPQASFSSLFKELTDIERVEVLAGPQSTLSGRNASGGLVNIVTREPSDYFAAEMNLEQTSDRQQRFSAFMTGPMAPTLAFSVSAFSNEWEGAQRSAVEQQGKRPLHLDGWDTQGARGKLRWQPSEHFNATLTAYSMESTKLTSAGGVYWWIDPQARFRNDVQDRSAAELFPGIDIKRHNRWSGSSRHTTNKTRDHGGSLKLEYDLGRHLLTSISAIAKADIPMHANIFDVPFQGMSFAETVDPYMDQDYRTEVKTQEFRLTSVGESRFDYVVGVIWSDTDTWYSISRVDLFPLDRVRTFDMQSAALFSRGTWHVGARDALTAGLRWQRDKMAYSWDNRPPEPVFLTSGSNRYDFLSGELSWRRELAMGVNAYVTLARAQSGKVYDMSDQRGAASGLAALDSQKVSNLEVGLKSQWWERRLTFNLNAFLANYDNYHIQTNEPPRDLNDLPIIKLYAIGEVETRGIELETRLRATDQLNVNVSATWMDATIKDYPIAPCYSRQTQADGCHPAPVPGGARYQDNLSGNRMPNTPKFKLSGAMNYAVPLDALPFDLELGASYRWQSSAWFDFRGNPNLTQGSFGILNVSASLHDRDGRYSLSVFVNNLLDKPFYSAMGDDTNFLFGPAYTGRFARDSFRYAGVSLRLNF